MGWRVGQGSGVRGSGIRVSSLVQGWVGGKDLEIWRSRNAETSC